MPRATKRCCKEKVTLTLRKLGHAKCPYDRKPHEKEGRWLNDAIGKKIFEAKKCTEFGTVLYSVTYGSFTTTRANPTSAYKTINPILLAWLKYVLQGPTKGLQPSKVDCTLSNFIEKFKLLKKFMDLPDRRRRDRIQLASQIVLKLSNAIDVSKDIKEKMDVANDVVIFIDAIKDHLAQTVLKWDLNDLSECVYHRPPDD